MMHKFLVSGRYGRTRQEREDQSEYGSIVLRTVLNLSWLLIASVAVLLSEVGVVEVRSSFLSLSALSSKR